MEYYRKVSEFYRLDVRQYHTVNRIEGADGAFLVHCTGPLSRPAEFLARKLVVATGYYDLPNRLDVPGEDLPKVSHYYREPHPYNNSDVVVVGARNSAAIAALELWRHGARVTLVHRGAAIAPNVKYWIKPDIENRIKNQEIAAFFNTTIREITPDAILLDTPRGEQRLKNDFVLAMTGYHPDFPFLRALGVELSRQPSSKPVVDTQYPGEQRGGNLSGGRHHRRHEYQRDFYRERALPRAADRRGPAAQAGQSHPCALRPRQRKKVRRRGSFVFGAPAQRRVERRVPRFRAAFFAVLTWEGRTPQTRNRFGEPLLQHHGVAGLFGDQAGHQWKQRLSARTQHKVGKGLAPIQLEAGGQR